MKKVFTSILKLSTRFLLFLFEIVLFFIALFAILTAVESCSPDDKLALDKDICFDDGNVWDYAENRCILADFIHFMSIITYLFKNTFHFARCFPNFVYICNHCQNIANIIRNNTICL